MINDKNIRSSIKHILTNLKYNVSKLIVNEILQDLKKIKTRQETIDLREFVIEFLNQDSLRKRNFF